MIDVALYQPDIAPNAATILRMCACFGLTCRIIEPAGFVMSEAQFRRAGMDYLDRASLIREASWATFRQATAGRRSVLMTTRSSLPVWSFAFRPGDVILMGRESSGVPESVHAEVEARLTIPMQPGLRSLNVALAAAIATGEALRQIRPQEPVS
ncbi:tRNA (cytidine(34)-2'-O)-methyltransferase [Aestuariivirga sp.]|jgi:tRNA (cytidine/uridine-2'-O-)-methyltransferase|uniref:tRNA (cytidine(34)-2'-O)-methyltransferase n=1 Tax=Aestuariivirga sp. TaxID=2650926 RepID=UPI003783DBCB